jgi:ribonucleoside-diphosphate reductase alpha chain
MTTKITSKIIDSQYIGRDDPAPAEDPGPKQAERPDVIPAKTYRIEPPVGPTGYLTIGDDPVTGSPIEIFYNSRDQAKAAWVMATTRLASRALQWGIPVDQVVKDLSRIDDPDGGYWTRGQWVGSLVAHIGMVLSQHARDAAATGQEVDEPAAKMPVTYEAPKGRKCPVCGEKAMQWLDGCWTCTACGHSKCG